MQLPIDGIGERVVREHPFGGAQHIVIAVQRGIAQRGAGTRRICAGFAPPSEGA